MREEMLKRLDKIIATAASVIAGADCDRQAIEDDWPVLRAELVAERCENCEYYGDEPEEGYEERGWRECVRDELGAEGREDMEGVVASPDFCCNRFDKKWACRSRK